MFFDGDMAAPPTILVVSWANDEAIGAKAVVPSASAAARQTLEIFIGFFPEGGEWIAARLSARSKACLQRCLRVGMSPWMWPDRHVSVNLTSGRKSRGASHIMRRTFAVGLVPPPCLAFGAHPLGRLGLDPLTQGRRARRYAASRWSQRGSKGALVPVEPSGILRVCARTFRAILVAIAAACQSADEDVRFQHQGSEGRWRGLAAALPGRSRSVVEVNWRPTECRTGTLRRPDLPPLIPQYEQLFPSRARPSSQRSPRLGMPSSQSAVGRTFAASRSRARRTASDHSAGSMSPRPI